MRVAPQTNQNKGVAARNSDQDLDWRKMNECKCERKGLSLL